MSLRSLVIASAVLLVVTFGLLANLYRLWTEPRPLPEIAVPAPALPEIAATGENGRQGTPLQPRQARSRPPFSETRRPPAPAAQPTTAPIAKRVEPATAPRVAADDLKISGIFIAGEDRRALISGPDDPQGVWIRPGEDYGGWTVDLIDTGHVEIASGGERSRVNLHEN